MKQLRILTGNHAGAEVRLSPGTHRVSAADDADIRICDWTGNDLLLAVDEAGVTSARRVAPDKETPDADAPDSDASLPDPGVVLMIDYVPMPFDDTVLCVGEEGAAWPSDLALLSTLLTRTDDADADAGTSAACLKHTRTRRMVALGVCVLAGVLGMGGLLSFAARQARANLPPADMVETQRADRAFKSAGLAELHASPDGHGGIVVTGMVASQSQDYTVRQMLVKIAPGAVTREYGIAEDIARSINDALGIEGTQVAYTGHGVFTITGSVASKPAVRQALARVRSDLNKSVKDVEVKVDGRDDNQPPVPDTPPGTYSVLVSSPRVQYTETPDGVKHIYTSGDETANGDGVDTEKTPQAALAVKSSNDVAHAMINHPTESFYVRGN